MGDDDDENMLEELKAEFKPLMKEEVGDARQQDIQRILEDFKGAENIPRIKSAKRRVLITKIKNEKGETITSQKGIANVFGEFYQKIFDDNGQEESEQEIGENENESSTDVHNNNTNEMTKIPAITCKLFTTITAQQIISTTRPKTSGRSGGIQKLIPDNRPSCDAQND